VKFLAGTLDIPTAATKVRLSSESTLNHTDRVLWARFNSREGNTGEVYVGDTNVSATNGVELEPEGAEGDKSVLEIPAGLYGGSIPAGDIYFDTDTNGNDIDWALLIDD
jgi:hypothetical protein